jgi:hypothetical protein
MEHLLSHGLVLLAKKSIVGAYYNEWARKVNKQNVQKKMELENKKLEMELWN